MQQQQSEEIIDDQIIKQAIACAKRSDWVVLFADCRVQRIAPDPRAAGAAADIWTVSMSAQPFYNQRLSRVMPLACHVGLLDGQLCAVSLYEPADRQPYLG